MKKNVKTFFQNKTKTFLPMVCKPNKIITYLNNGVYTQYIIHMPIILVTLYYLKDIELFWGMKFIIINVTTIIGCLTFFETMKLNKITRTLFGIKSKTITAK